MTRVTLTQGVMDITVNLTATDCAQCSVVFAVPDRLIAERREDGKAFYCPNGHSLVFQPSEADKLRKDLAAAVRDREWFKQGEQNQRQLRESAERSASAYKGQATKLRKRAIAGVCAFCRRHFVNVERHVSTKHPTATPEPETVAP
jgi:hypothetical protein